METDQQQQQTGARPPRTRTSMKLMKEICRAEVDEGHGKVSIVGCEHVGMGAAFSMLTMGVCSDLALYNKDDKDAAIGEKMDLMHGLAFLGRRVHIDADDDFAVTKNSQVIVITSEIPQKEDESRRKHIQNNVDMFKEMIPDLVKYSPDAVVIVVSEPCDIMAWVTWKISGLPKHRVIAPGTMLDTSRFRHLLADRFNVAPHSCQAYIIGEHGETSVPVWSSVSVVGTKLRDIYPLAGDDQPHGDDEQWYQLHRDVVNAADEITNRKGHTSWGIGIMIAKLTDAIIRNQRSVFTLSTSPDGWNGIKDDVFFSIPVCIGEKGITHLLSQKLDDSELEKMKKSAKALCAVIDRIKL